MEPYQELEREWERFTAAPHAVSCSSGTAALHLALEALDIGAGDEVIVPDFTMAAVAFAVSYTRATPVFGDVSLSDYGLLPSEVERLITPKTRAVIVVHTYGRLAPIEKIIEICRPRGIKVIEDACEAQGAIKASKADATCYSFYRNKIIAAEEGGMLTTIYKEIAETAAYLKNMSFGARHDYFHEHLGFNYRMANSQARLALASLHKYPMNAGARRRIEVAYKRELKELGHEVLGGRAAVWFYETPAEQRKITGIPGARLPFKPLSSFPMYGSGKGGQNALTLSKKLVLLPVDPAMTDEQVREICLRA